MIKTVKVKSYGKINIGLNVSGEEGGYHMLDTVLAGISIYDEITVRTVKDKNINLQVSCDAETIAVADNNAYKAAKAFSEYFGTFGADIKLKKNIPVGSGLGGSAADIVGVVRAMDKAYGVGGDLVPLVNSLCSDGEFLLCGGFARVNGRGMVKERFRSAKPLYLVIAVPEGQCGTADVFAEFDKGVYPHFGADTDGIVADLKSGEKLPQREIFNALSAPAFSINPEVEKVYGKVFSLSPDFMSVSGSGSAVYASFETPELCLWAKQKLAGECAKVFVCETVNA